MADEKDTEKKEEEQKKPEAMNVASLSIPTIVTALHQTALAKTNAESKGARIVNSAIDDSKKNELKSAGEHLISVLPLESGKEVKKADAVQLIKTYVQWFVGPDLASKVDDKTVKSLLEAPGTPKEEKKVEESRHFMSFKRFLLEAEGEEKASSTEGDGTSNDGKQTEDGSTPVETSETKPSKEGEKDNNKEEENDESISSKAGYYVTYNLKIEGLKQSALADAMGKFALTFFDDVTFKADGLFGGGDSFSIKDVKDKIRDVFGPIDPNDLVDKVETEINKIKHPNTDAADVKIRDKRTLIADLGKNIDAAQKQKIASAAYSLWILLPEYDPKKPIFNRRVVADIVTSSVKGLFKKFKNKVTKDDVIYIQNYQDQHGKTKDLEKLNVKVPEPSELAAIAHPKKNNESVASIWGKIDARIDKIINDKQLSNSKLGNACVNVWKQFKDKHKDDSKRTSGEVDTAYFDTFIAEYTKVFDKYKDQQDLHESSACSTPMSLDEVRDICTNSIALRNVLLENLFMPKRLDEDESTSGDIASSKKASTTSNGTKDLLEIKNIALKQFGTDFNSNQSTVEVDSKDNLKKALEKFDLSKFDSSFGDFTYGLAVDFAKVLSESSLKDSIMDILFEKEKGGDDGKTDSKDAALPIDAVKETFKKIAEEAQIQQHGDVFELKLGSTSSEADEQSIQKQIASINDSLNSNAKKQMDEVSGKASSPMITIAKTSRVVEFLTQHGIGSQSDYDKLDKEYTLVCWVKKDGIVDGVKYNGTPGWQALTKDAVTSLFKTAASNVQNVITLSGKPTNLMTTNDELFKKKKLGYYKDKTIPAETDVYLASVDLEDITAKGTQAFVLPFDKTEGGDEGSGDEGSKESSSNKDNPKYADLYIIPMPGLKYKDKEYNTYA